MTAFARSFRLAAGPLVVAALAACDDDNNAPATPAFPVTQAQLAQALRQVVGNPPAGNGGLNLNMWATIVDRTGAVVAVAFSGARNDDQWPGSRVISAQKANTANAFSLRGLALSTANLYSAVQPGGSLYGLQFSNPVDPQEAYTGNAADYGTVNDPMVGKRVGGVNVFGGGLALYDAQGELIGALGVSGDTSCSDHIIAWRLRDALQLDKVPAGVAPNTGGRTSDNIIHDITGGQSAGGFGHPTCSTAATTLAANLITSHPTTP